MNSKSYIEIAIEKVLKGNFYLSHHAQIERGEERIRIDDIVAAISSGQELEPYPDDPRGASCLVLDFTSRDRPLHVICGRLEEDEILIITAYEPDPEEWEADWKTRKKGAMDA